MDHKHHICEAETFGEYRACGRCQLVWPREGAKPACLAAADPPITLGRMAETAGRFARHEEQGQAARVRTGDRDRPHMETLYDAAVLRAAARVLALIDGDDTARARLAVLKKAAAP